MLLRPTLVHSHVSFTSAGSYSSSLPGGPCSISPSSTFPYSRKAVTCSASKVRHRDGKSMVKWNDMYKKISSIEIAEFGSASVLDRLELEGQKPSKWALCRTVKELRKFKNFKRALEVYEWMNDHGTTYEFSASDAAIQLDLISKVQGITGAEIYFQTLSNELKEKRVYGALLNAYARARMKEKAESLLDEIRSKGHFLSSLVFNVMMTLYMKLKQFDNVESMISEMMEKGIKLDVYSYNIWLSSCGLEGSLARMEQVLGRMRLDRTLNPNWSTFTMMASMYIRAGESQKATECLKMAEIRVFGRDHFPYHYLIKLYGRLGEKGEVYRIWNLYKSSFVNIRNVGYYIMISSLSRMDDVEGAKEIYDEWLSVKLRYDPRIGGILLRGYVKNGDPNQVDDFFNHMVEVGGGKASSSTWEIMAEWHINGRRVASALSCLKEAGSVVGSKGWVPRLTNVLSFLKLCEEEDNMKNREDLMVLLREKGCLDMGHYASALGVCNGSVVGETDGFAIGIDQMSHGSEDEVGLEGGALN